MCISLTYTAFQEADGVGFVESHGESLPPQKTIALSLVPPSLAKEVFRAAKESTKKYERSEF